MHLTLRNLILKKLKLDAIIEAVQNGAEGEIVDVEDEENQTKVNFTLNKKKK
jgi:hypothetical protein